MPRPLRLLALAALFFLSGAVALGYQLVWLRWFALLFGNTTQAAATVLAVFFAGLGLGYKLLGPVADRSGRLLLWYAALEGVAALLALAVGPILASYATLHPLIADGTSDSGAAVTLARIALAAIALLPCAIALGGTLPVLGRAAVLQDEPGVRFLRPTALLYGANTLGAVLGTLLAGIWLPPRIGVHNTLLVAIGVGVGVALLACLLSLWLKTAPEEAPTELVVPSPEPPATSRRLSPLAVVAAVSGFCTLAAEVAFTRIFALTFHNSVYTYALVAGVCIFALSMGSFAVAGFEPAVKRKPRALLWLLILSGAAVALAGWFFSWRTGFDAWALGAGWPGYLWACLGLVASTLLLPFALAGAVLPLTWTLHAKERPGRVGAVIGGLTAWNTAGAIAGSLFAGFVAVPLLGLFGTLAGIALIYLGAVICLAGAAVFGPGGRSIALRGAAVVAAALTVIAMAAVPPPQYVGAKEELVELFQGSAATVAVVRKPGGHVALKVDNFYTLGQTSHAVLERRLGHIPMLLHPNPESVAVIGYATGITAGATLAHSSVRQLTVAEIVPEVIEADSHFRKHNGGVLQDPRVKLVVGDGRNHIAHSGQQYDVVIGDLFVPWQAGSGSMYSVEHFENVRRALREGGRFCQWLPLYQLSGPDLDAIAAAFFRVFPDGEVWQLGLGFMLRAPVLGFVSGPGERPLSMESMARRLPELVAHWPERDPYLAHVSSLMLLFAGRPAPGAFAEIAANRDDRPILEYSAPASQARAQSVVLDGLRVWLGERLRPWASAAERYEFEIRSVLIEVSLAAARGDSSGVERMGVLLQAHDDHPFLVAVMESARLGGFARTQQPFFTDVDYFAGLVPL